MIIYNVTLKVHWSIHENWLKWMKETHIPDVMNTGCFTGNRLVRVLDIDEEEGPTYASQYHAQDRSQYTRYIDEFAPVMRKHLVDMWGDKVFAFRSLMEVVN
jgi:hypothetical protein